MCARRGRKVKGFNTKGTEKRGEARRKLRKR
jgi:hypothetical protein